MSHESHHISLNHDKKVLWICICLNLLFVVIETIAGLYGNSMGLLSDAGHNLSDVLGLLLAVLAIALTSSGKNPRIANFVTLCNSLLLLVAVVVIAAESVRKMFAPVMIDGNMIMVTAGAGILINGITAFLLMKGQRRDINIKAAYLHAASDALVSVSVVVSGILITVTGWNIIDSIMSLAVALLIAFPTIKLLIQSIKILKNETHC